MTTLFVKVDIVTKNKIDYFLRIKCKNNSYNYINIVNIDVF